MSNTYPITTFIPKIPIIIPKSNIIQKKNQYKPINYEQKINEIFNKIVENDSDLLTIYKIYLEIKKNQYINDNSIIKNLIEEIKKNQFTDVQYFILALLIFRLINIDKLKLDKKPGKNSISINEANKYEEYVTTGLKNNKNFSNKTIRSIIDASYNTQNYRNFKKQYIIYSFIDEFIEVSKERSILKKKIESKISDLERISA